MNNIFLNIDTYRLAGVKSILGIEFSDTGAKVVEIAKTGNPFNKYKASFSQKASFTLGFNPQQTLESKSEELKRALSQQGIESRRAVVGLTKETVKVIEGTIPHSAENIADWITEHLDELLKLPIPMHQIKFAYKIVESNKIERKVLIAFIRNEKLDEIVKIAESAGLQAIGIKVMDTDDRQQAIANQLPGVSQDYATCASLAIAGFFPELKTIDFLPESAQESFEIETYKSLFQRMVIALGIVLIVLLCIPFLFSKYLEFREADLEGKLISIGPVYTEVRSLEQQVQELERQLSGAGRSAQRSDFARVLYNLAESSEDGLWFTKLTSSEETSGRLVVLINGYAKGSEAISTFMRKLEQNSISREVSLIRSGHMNDRAQAVEVKNIPKSFSSFELRVVL